MATRDHSNETRYCKGCFYPLAGLQAHGCPECGRAFDPSRPRTTSRYPETAADRAMAKFVFVMTVLSVPAALGVVVVSAIGAEPLVLWMIGIAFVPFAMVLIIPPALLSTRISRPVRALALLSVLVVASVVLTGWPFALMFSAHRQALTAYAERVRSGEVAPGRVTRQVGGVRVIAVGMTPEGNVGLQLTGGAGGGVYLVHTVKEHTFIWYNTNWEQTLGGGWYRVYED